MPLSRIFIIIALTFIAYSFMLSSPFKTMDDNISIVVNPLIKDTAKWPQLFKQGYFGDHTYYRPLVNLSFAVEHKAFGLNSFFYNLDNLLLHIANALLVWMLVGYLVNLETGFWVALLFAIHPIQWECVANISGRAILLSVFFALLSFIAHLKERRVVALLSFAVALLCKESAVVLPGILLLYDWIQRRNMHWIWAWGVVIAAYVGLRHYLGITEFFPWRNAHEHVLGVLTFLRSVIMDVRLLIFPTDLHFDRSMKLFSSPTESGALMTMFICLVVLAWLGVARKVLSGMNWFAIGWLALVLLPVSQIISTIGVQPGTISTADHFLYMALIPFFMLIFDGVSKAAVFMQERRIASAGVMWGMGIIFLGFLFVTTITQNIYAGNELIMMERSLAIQPDNARLQGSVGVIYALRGDYRIAQGHLEKAVRLEPLNVRYRISLAQDMCDQKQWVACLGQYVAIDNPGKYREQLPSRTQAAFAHVQHELDKGKILDEKSWFILGLYYVKTKNVDAAMDAFGKVLVINPSNQDALFNLASLRRAEGYTQAK